MTAREMLEQSLDIIEINTSPVYGKLVQVLGYGYIVEAEMPADKQARIVAFGSVYYTLEGIDVLSGDKLSFSDAEGHFPTCIENCTIEKAEELYHLDAIDICDINADTPDGFYAVTYSYKAVA